MSASARVADAWRRERFTGGFMLLALASGTTIGMAQLATTLLHSCRPRGCRPCFRAGCPSSCWLCARRASHMGGAPHRCP
ncbi:hypothetical protein WT01_02370 [Burkholderia cepacia]|uniref:hypothetical protein n=1 Tax=Burkholderia cepacia TaxID=292 RepID=UPI00075B3C9E|nr:hypothetical protein [Burkholderia cepacia]KVL44611.1 hypothetical protein WT01_02370 [Burkholderia cepacia]